MNSSSGVPRRVRYSALFAIANDMPSFIVPLMVFYGADHLGISAATTIILFYGVGGLSNFLEVPAGAFADRFGRKLSYFLGISLSIIGNAVWLFAAPIAALVGGRIIFAIGDALRSGTVDAMMYEEHQRHGQSDKYLRFTSVSRSWFYLVRLVGMPLGAFLFSIDVRLPMYVTIISLILSACAVLLIPDRNEMPAEHTTFTLMKSTISQVIKQRPIRIMFLAVFLMSMLSESFWRMFQPAYDQSGLDVKYIGICYAAFSFMALISNMLMDKISTRRRVIYSMSASLISIVVLYSLGAAIPAIGVTIFVQLCACCLFSVIETPVPVYIQGQFEKYQQATLLSLFSMMLWGGAALGGLCAALVLIVVDVHGVFVVLAIASAVVASLFVPLLWSLRHDNAEIGHDGVVPEPEFMR